MHFGTWGPNRCEHRGPPSAPPATVTVAAVDPHRQNRHSRSTRLAESVTKIAKGPLPGCARGGPRCPTTYPSYNRTSKRAPPPQCAQAPRAAIGRRRRRSEVVMDFRRPWAPVLASIWAPGAKMHPEGLSDHRPKKQNWSTRFGGVGESRSSWQIVGFALSCPLESIYMY